VPHVASPAEFFRPADEQSPAPRPASRRPSGRPHALTRRLGEALVATALAAGFALFAAAPAVATGGEPASIAVHGAGHSSQHGFRRQHIRDVRIRSARDG